MKSKALVHTSESVDPTGQQRNTMVTTTTMVIEDTIIRDDTTSLVLPR